MNERFKELEKQATTVVEGWSDERGTTRYYEFNREKFAELIVKECVQSIQADMDRETINGTISLAKHAGMVSAKTVIKRHFGVN